MIRKNLFTLILSLITFAATAQVFNKNKMDSLLNAAQDNNQAMGSLALMQSGTIVYQKAIGIKASGSPADVHTKYRIGSISKMFTAVMILQLAEENKINLNTPLSTFYPQMPNAEKITIRMLLDHRSGLHNITNDPAYAIYYTKPHTEAEMLKIIGDNRPDFEPDSKYEYSNTNFILLGYIIEKRTGETYAEALRSRIVSKLGLKETYYGGKIDPAADEAGSFSYDNGWKPLPETDMSIPGGAGGIISSPSDLVRFLNALFNGKLISNEYLQQMKTMRDGYGFAMVNIPFYGIMGYGHNGDIDGFSSIAWYFPDRKLAIAYCGNGIQYGINDLMIGVLSIYFNKPYTIPSFKTIKVDAAVVQPYLGIYSCPGFPLKITLSYGDGILKAQATGQSSFPLNPSGDHVFTFKPAGIVITLSPSNSTFVLQQGGASHTFTKTDAK